MSAPSTPNKWWNVRNASFVLLSILVTVFIFRYLFTIISWHDVVEMISAAKLQGVLLFLVFSFSQSIARTWQYRTLLAIHDVAVPRIPLFLIILVRNFFSDLLPARLGQLIYIYLVNNRLRIPLTLATASFALAFIFDIVAVVPLILTAVMLVGGDVIPFRGTLAIAACVLAALSFLAVLLLPRAIMIARHLFHDKDNAHSLRSRFADFLDRTKHAVEQTQRAGVYTQVFILSALVRFLKYTALYFFLYALLAPRGYALVDLSIAKSFIGLCAAEFAASMPISGLGGFGLYEGTWAFTFQLLGFPKEIAVLTSVAHHLFTQLYGYLLALVSLALLLLPVWGGTDAGSTTQDSNLRFFLKLLGFLCGAGVLAFLVFAAAE